MDREGKGAGLTRLRPPSRQPAAKMLSSALWLRLGVGAGQWGPHFSGEGLGGIEKEGKAEEEALRLLGWGRANKAGSVRVGVGGLACTDNLKDGGGGVGVCVSHHPKPSLSPNNLLSQRGQPLFSDPGFTWSWGELWGMGCWEGAGPAVYYHLTPPSSAVRDFKKIQATLRREGQISWAEPANQFFVPTWHQWLPG